MRFFELGIFGLTEHLLLTWGWRKGCWNIDYIDTHCTAYFRGSTLLSAYKFNMLKQIVAGPSRNDGWGREEGGGAAYTMHRGLERLVWA